MEALVIVQEFSCSCQDTLSAHSITYQTASLAPIRPSLFTAYWNVNLSGTPFAIRISTNLSSQLYAGLPVMEVEEPPQRIRPLSHSIVPSLLTVVAVLLKSLCENSVLYANCALAVITTTIKKAKIAVIRFIFSCLFSLIIQFSGQSYYIFLTYANFFSKLNGDCFF